MPDLRRVLRDRLAPFRLDAALEAELVEELAQHLEQDGSVPPLVALSRITRDELGEMIDLRELTAREAVRVAVGMRSESGDARQASPRGALARWVADGRDDVRYALRTLVRARLFSTVVILTLGLGIGATTAMYSVVDAVLVRSLPFADPDRLVRILPARVEGRENLSIADFLAVRERGTAFASIAEWGTFDDGLTFTGAEHPERVYGAVVSGDFFVTLGVTPLLGRTYTREDELPGAPPAIILSFDFWSAKLGARTDIIGRSVEIQGSHVPVVGVMPPGFWFPRGDRAEFWTNHRPTTPACECNFTKRVVARLRPGVNSAQAQAQLDAAAADVRTRFSGSSSDWSFTAAPLRESMVRDVRPVLVLLMIAVALVLLIACVNVTNLMLARGASRESELAVRAALGAGGGRLARQLLVEAGVLSIAGGIIGIAIAYATLSVMLATVPVSIPLVHDVRITIDGDALALAGVSAFVCMLLAGALPALVAARADAGQSLKATHSHGASRAALRDALVIAEVAISLTLVVGAGLMIRSLAKLRAVDLGVGADGVFTASVSLPGVRYSDARRIRDFTERLLSGLTASPAVLRAAVATALPPGGVPDQRAFSLERTDTTSPNRPVADHVLVSGDFFAALHIPIITGRSFDAGDRDAQASPALISQALARRFFAGRDPIGQFLWLPGDRAITVVGVVGDIRFRGPANQPTFTIYEPFEQFPQWSFSVVVHTASDPSSLIIPLRRVLAAIDPTIPVAQARTLEELIDRSTGANRFRAELLGALAGLALLLASVGIYGLMSFVVTLRARDLGIRLALGAKQSEILVLVIRHAVVRAVLGVLLGLAGALVLGRFLRTLVFGIASTDALTLAASAALFVVVAAFAAWFPAWRGSRTDPMLTLRRE